MVSYPFILSNQDIDANSIPYYEIHSGPNPLASARASDFDEGYKDNHDRNSKNLQAQLKNVKMKDVLLINGEYRLNGPMHIALILRFLKTEASQGHQNWIIEETALMIFLKHPIYIITLIFTCVI